MLNRSYQREGLLFILKLLHKFIITSWREHLLAQYFGGIELAAHISDAIDNRLQVRLCYDKGKTEWILGENM